MVNEKNKKTYKVNLPNELPLVGQVLARYTSMQTSGLITMEYTPERAVRNVIRRQTRDNEFYCPTILNALKLEAHGSIEKYAVQLPQNIDMNADKTTKDLERVIDNDIPSDSVTLQ